MTVPDLPRRLGRYRLLKALGRGAMGMVYEAEDPHLGRLVAIKTILHDALHDRAVVDDFSRRFRREAQAAGRLNHPHIVTVHDFGSDGASSFIVMEYVRGRDLARALASGERFAVAETVRIVGELLDALAYAHERGIVHRDVKPANVLLDEACQVKLADFGVARIAEFNADRTMPGTMVGSPSYMSPEQIQGQAVGSRADLFAVGVVLYQMLTGRKPFEGGGPFEVQRKIVQEDPVPPSRADPHVPREFDPVVMRALDKRPQARFESARAFADALLRALRDAEAKGVGRNRFAATGVRQRLRSKGDAVAFDAAKGTRAKSASRLVLTVAGLGAAAAVSVGWWLSRPQSAAPPSPPARVRPAIDAASDRRPEPAAIDVVPGSSPPAGGLEPFPSLASPPPQIPPPQKSPSQTSPLSGAAEAVPGGIVAPTRSAQVPSSPPVRPTAGAGEAARAAAASRTVVPAPRRCAELTQRLQLGEPLGADDQDYMEQTCRR